VILLSLAMLVFALSPPHTAGLAPPPRGQTRFQMEVPSTSLCSMTHTSYHIDLCLQIFVLVTVPCVHTDYQVVVCLASEAEKPFGLGDVKRPGGLMLHQQGLAVKPLLT
jgi:hypothetical protein